MFRTGFAPRQQLDGRRARRLIRRPDLDQLESRQLLTSMLTATSNLISPAPVENASFTAVVAKFTDADKNTDPTEYVAEINWGNGLVTKGTVSTDPVTAGTFDVTGTNTYVNPGSYPVFVQVADKDGDTASVQTTNIIGDAAITAMGSTINATQNSALTNAVVATFSSADSALPASAFSATINWGDGHSSAGVVLAAKGGGFMVEGSHTYSASGAFSVQVAIQQGNSSVVSTQFYTATNLISDGAVPADHLDADLVNPWGLVAGAGGPFWSSNNGTGTSSLYDGMGDISAGLPMVTVPPPAGATGPSAPTGIVAPSSGFVVSDGVHSGAAAFVFDTEDGTISGWNPKVAATGPGASTNAVLEVDNSASGAVYKGLALLTVPSGNTLPAGQYLFVTNFHAGTVEIYNSSYQAVTAPTGAFQDPTIPAGFAPFGIQAINGNLYVTYAKQDAEKHDDVAGAGNGYVDVFSPSGILLQRLGGPGVQPELNSPWGVVQAPANFGTFSNDILVGNFGDSHISAFNPVTGAFVGQISNAQGQPMTFTGGFQGSSIGLWGISFGNGNGSGATNTLYFNSGINDEADGVFGSITATSVATTTASSIASVVPVSTSPGGGGGGGGAPIPVVTEIPPGKGSTSHGK